MSHTRSMLRMLQWRPAFQRCASRIKHANAQRSCGARNTKAVEYEWNFYIYAWSINNKMVSIEFFLKEK